MLIAHLLVNARTLPRARHLAHESVASEVREPVHASCGIPRRSDVPPRTRAGSS